MKRVIVVLVLVMSASLFGQETASPKWKFGFGVNFIDNSALESKQFFKTNNWNAIDFISLFSADYAVGQNLAIGGTVSMNELSKDNNQNGGMITKDVLYVAFDANARYTFDQHLVDVAWFDASVVGGAGLFMVDGKGNQTLNGGLALDFWFSKTTGIRLQTLGKFALEEDLLGNNHIQHSAQFVVKF